MGKINLTMFSVRPLSSSIRQSFATARRSFFSLSHDEYGPAYEVMQLKEHPDLDAASLGPKEVLARMLMAPVNPTDVNMIQVFSTNNNLST